MTTIEFGPYKDFKPKESAIKPKYKFPWDKVTDTGQAYGFFVGVKKKPKPPSTLKHRTWDIVPAEYNGEKGYYCYIKSFNNGRTRETIFES